MPLTNKGFFIPLGILVIDAKFPILLLSKLDFFLFSKFAIYFTKISAVRLPLDLARSSGGVG